MYVHMGISKYIYVYVCRCMYTHVYGMIIDAVAVAIPAAVRFIVVVVGSIAITNVVFISIIIFGKITILIAIIAMLVRDIKNIRYLCYSNTLLE